MRVVYDILLACWALVISPSVLYSYMFHRKYRNSILFRLGLKMPKVPLKNKGEYRIWIHAVSLGETKAVAALVKKIREARQDAVIIFSNTTETGQKEAKERQKEINFCFFLPLDFSWLMKKLVKRVDPDLFILVETDFWYNLLTELKTNKTRVVVVNGKISTSSYKNFKKFKHFSKALFDPIEIFCLQSETDKSRFFDLGVPEEKLTVTGNMKFDIKPTMKRSPELKFPKNKKLVTIASTHENEEELILSELQKLENDQICYLLVPRHPERFIKIAKLLKKKQIPFRTITEEESPLEKVILVNKMGVMDECYAASFLAIMGGSFVSHIGGHNIFEPVQHGIPVIYGPHMHKQESLINSLKNYPIGKQVPLHELTATLESYLKTPFKPLSTEILVNEVEGATERSFKKLRL